MVLTHFDSNGAAHMVDVSEKAVTPRIAIAKAWVKMQAETFEIIKEGHATTEDLDRAIEDGPGLRWSLMGTFLTFHLAGGKAGMRHMLKQFGPALKLPWTKLKAPKLSNKLIDRLVQGTKKQSKGKSVSKISNIRDEYLVELQKLRKRYEKKLR